MKHRIDPKVDCVFKAILGKDENKNLLIHFLNAILEPEEESRIKAVVIENPYNEREFVGDRLSVVDVKATDQSGRKLQVEIQMAVHPALASRILFTWSGIYRSLIGEGDDYGALRPVISVWILNGNLFPDMEKYHLPFSIYSPEHGIAMTDHLSIHVLQLPKWRYDGTIKTEKDRWIYLFRDGKNVDGDNPPPPFNTKEMRQVMKVMNRFSENQKDWLMYQSRLDAILTRNTIEREHERVLETLEKTRKIAEQAEIIAARAEKTAERAEKKAKRAEKKAKRAEEEKDRAENEKDRAEKEKERTEKQLNALRQHMKKKRNRTSGRRRQIGKGVFTPVLDASHLHLGIDSLP